MPPAHSPATTGAQEGGGTAPGASLSQRLQQALAGDEHARGRLSSANTSVTIYSADRPGAGVTLLLDRRPPVVVGEDEPAEIVIELTGEQIDQFAAGELVVASAIMSGSVAYRGPVRKFMAVAPILRGLLSSPALDGHARE